MKGISIMEFSQYQKGVFDFIQNNEGNGIVNALAGSGKTFTIVKATEMVGDASILLLAFNASIKKELETKVSSNCDVLTTHSYGLRCFPRRPRVDKWAKHRVFQEILGIDKFRQKNSKEDNEKFDICMKLCAFVQSACIHPDNLDVNQVISIADFYAVDINGFDMRDITDIIKTGLEKILSSLKSVDFDGMIYIPAVNGWSNRDRYDFVFIDEAQDLNATQIALIKAIQSKNPNCRFIFVGDPNQAIYGFRGAGTDTFPIIKREFQTTEMPLSICYRCSKKVIRDAQRFVPEIEAFDNAIDGEVVWDVLFSDGIEEIRENPNNTIILSRKNAPNVATCYALLKEKISATIVGRDVADNLVKTVKKIANSQVLPIADFSQRLDQFIRIKIDKFLDRGMDAMADSFYDLQEIFIEIIDNPNENGDFPKNSQDVLDEINKLFARDEDGNVLGVKLMSIHKSKGLEADFVWINSDFKFKASTDEQKQQEKNLKYVAATRAKVKTTYFCLKEE